MTRHRTPEELEAFRNGEMGLVSLWLCRRHLRSCALCREKLQEIRNDDDFLHEIARELDAYDRMTRELENDNDGAGSRS